MEKFKLVKVNTGKAVHLAKYFETPSGVTGYDVHCGSGKTGFRDMLHKVAGEVKLENITCKKCQQRYLEWQEEEKPEVNYSECKVSELINIAIEKGVKWRKRVDGKDVKMNKNQLVEALKGE